MAKFKADRAGRQDPEAEDKGVEGAQSAINYILLKTLRDRDTRGSTAYCAVLCCCIELYLLGVGGIDDW